MMSVQSCRGFLGRLTAVLVGIAALSAMAQPATASSLWRRWRPGAAYYRPYSQFRGGWDGYGYGAPNYGGPGNGPANGTYRPYYAPPAVRYYAPPPVRYAPSRPYFPPML